MCGIAGIVNLDDQPVKGIQLVKINDALRHRGPDDEGYYLAGQVGLAAGRGMSGTPYPLLLR